MNKSKGYSAITGKTVQELQRSLDSAIKDIYRRINTLSDSTSTGVPGRGKMEGDNSSIRFIEDKEGLYMEVKSKKGWARLPQSLEVTTKRD